MYFINAPFFLRWYYPGVIWNKSRADKNLYLTFDDGPIPEITPWILDVLAKYNVKATFFCVGENIEKYPLIFERIIAEGHQIGNHTYNHLKGWDYEDDEYVSNVYKCHKLIQARLFRPPYARAKKSQLNLLKNDFDFIYWDVLSGDFDTKISPEKCLKNVLKHTKNGSIIVFHDNIKAIPRVQYALPEVIKYYLEKGYTFQKL
ncbi:polysaccharide deacetylase family protein [Sphingobacterium bovistauri]|uniref:Polysaccharide deacetylase family protein n=1 Tax=Sphingobacterium bovistauri TaxID=2781959 RepID=A0ABS7Z7E3_9SPHI|nr:polysaccharide deacetylase family protein [Sphingobacterium bovistauri]MCA5004869.1 polysaccharide deacetylase family protein [Sphingobacterium bovistauri]